jgi:hypothetical protein
MARCEGTTRRGDRCKREAQDGSRFCYLHDQEKAQQEDGNGNAASEDVEFMDLAPLLLAGVFAAGLVFLLKGFGRWIPRI